MAEEKVDMELIEKLKKGEIFTEEPETVDPTEHNQKDLVKGGGGESK